jgi:hypothetical protein
MNLFHLRQIEVTSTKELVLDIDLLEKVEAKNEIIVRGRKSKINTINNLVSVSGRTFSIEESQRFAGSRGDVLRMSQSFAGVQGANDSRNDVIVRGNSPSGVLFRLNGVDIPNPNHFAAAGATGGPISMLNNNVLANSDFLTGAFPAEFGNATAAVFDLSYRPGNNENHEFLGQIGFAGLELMAEGPLNAKKDASYLVNYRYSALGFFSLIGLDFGTGAAIPKYQDINFNINLPDKKGFTQVFGLGGISTINLLQSTTIDDNLYREGLEDLVYGTNTGMVGVTRFQRLSDKTSINTTLSWDAAQISTVLDTFRVDNGLVKDLAPQYRNDSYQGKYALNSSFQRRHNPQHLTKVGIRFYNFFFNLQDSFYSQSINQQTQQPFGWVQPVSFNGNTSLLQTFATHQIRLNNRLTTNLGLNHSYFFYNGSSSIEPRLGFQYKVNGWFRISGGYGLHSQLAPFRVYFEKARDNFGNERVVNNELGFSKSHHFILANDFSINRNTRLKIEAYYQSLFDVPIDGGSNVYYSLLNQGSDFTVDFTDSMVNEGTGRNFGLELTFERFLSKGIYFLNTVSIYRSLYTDKNDVEHSTAFDNRYALNILGGKEFYFKEGKDNRGKAFKSSLTTDLRLLMNGGRRVTPIDLEASRLAGATIRDVNNIYGSKLDDYIRLDFRIAFKVQNKRVNQEWGVDIQNVTNRLNVFNQVYNATTNEVRTTYQTGILPIGIYRLFF